jgi:hypothetical protein
MNPRVKMRGYGSAAILVLTGTVAWLMIQVPTLQDHADASNVTANQALKKVGEVEDQVAANAKALADANAKLVALGKAPVPVPSPPPAQASPEGLTASELQAVRAVVVDELDSHNAKVSQDTITQITKAAGTLAAQNVNAGLGAAVKSVVAAYCVDDKCVKKPKDGKDGTDGKDAPAVTDEQLLTAATQALVAYCGQESKPCQGKDGKDGTNGADAPPPYSVVDQDCIGDDAQSFWRIYLSNGTEQRTVDAAGPCRIGPAPN